MIELHLLAGGKVNIDTKDILSLATYGKGAKVQLIDGTVYAVYETVSRIVHMM